MRKSKNMRMKNEYITESLLVICLLLTGCGVTDNGTDMLQPESERNTAMIDTAPKEFQSETDSHIVLQEVGNRTESEILPDFDYALAYYEFLEKYAKESKWVEMEHAKFSLAFIDDDEVPELLLFYDNSHAAGVKVYTYCQNEVIELGEFGSTGRMLYVEHGGMICSCFTGFGESISGFFQLNEGTADLICSLHDWQNYDNGTYYYEIDEVSVSKETYDAKWNELYESREYVLIGYDDGITIIESELALLLTEAVNALSFESKMP